MLDIKTFRVPGAAPCVLENTVTIEGTMGYPTKVQQCVAAGDEDLSFKEDEDDDNASRHNLF